MAATPANSLPLRQLTSGSAACEPGIQPKTAENLFPSPDEPDETNTPTILRGAYVHVPFCFHKCHYCDFYSIVDSQDRQGAFVTRLIEEMAAVAPRLTHPLRSIFFGGGTPTLLRPDLWLRVLQAIHTHLPLADDAEFTIEANPETVTEELVRTLLPAARSANAARPNRFSIGCQSFDLCHLKTLERWHDPSSVPRAVTLLRDAGVSNINLDLIFAIPGQTLDDVERDLDQALALEPEHLSCYGLVYEPNTAMTARMQRGDVQPADEALEAAMYERIMDRLSAAGFVHYEVSNWARRMHDDVPGELPQRAARHNVMYWSNESWWPLGPGAAGHDAGTRWKNVPRIGSYLESGPWPPICDVERIDEDGRIGEQLMLGLRMIRGIALGDLQNMLARGSRGEARTKAIATHTKAGLLETADNRLRFTRAGLLLADTVLADLV